MAENNREEPRRAVLKTGQIYFGDPEECHDCLVWDLNRAGALIEVDPGTMPTELLRLISAGLSLNQLCRIVWQRGRKVELTFVI